MTSPVLTASTSTTLYAVPSKEWVIQPKPKPGRKPKKDASATPVEDPDGKGRRVQNRAAQRAFRERKQSQLAELQARVQSYEQGEIERNVALQNIAKRLKEENESLRRENTMLKETIDKMEKEYHNGFNTDKKWLKDDSPTACSSRFTARKRPRIDDDSQDTITLSHITPSFSSASPVSMASSLESSHSPFSPIPLDSPRGNPPLHNLINLSLPEKGDSFVSSVLPAFSGCGLCSDGTSCVCREALQNPIAVAPPPPTLKIEAFEPAQPPTIIRIGSPMASTILDNLPEVKPAVPLRRRHNGATSNPIFTVVSLSSGEKPTCSGDPDNCLACADDSFGKAFCAALGESIAAQSSMSSSSCGNCPCGPRNFGVNPAVVSLSSSPDSLSPAPTPPPPCNEDMETIPTDDAWRQLKAHPNVAFADLALLADVVARRSKCTGPRVVISPAPGTVTPERVSSPAGGDAQPILLTDPHAHYREQERARSTSSPPPQLVPQEILLKCGQERVREVQAAGVRDALRLLDAKFS
ncbi:hypothetical protein E1B28_001174 [Marasmius oreades]|uniref:BZIP domain-containing protein n=1 Tax=Marasmius oreades TaxID=181124 RepID=A0A9P7V2Y7_9AGAR|nr:uncharacterized protein E1B28_001174 [Marasmius oreades]KAG7099316.1 hypothetical protein E1B28_001174 [Marasmius oreades]